MQEQGIKAKQLLAKTKNRQWFGTDYNMNIYRGCHHGCIYCDSRSECYQIEDFDTVTYKEQALQILNKELQGKRNRGVVGFGAMSDAYNHLEKKKKLTAGALQLFDTHGFGVSLATKSDLLTRDIPLFQAIQVHSPVNLGFSFSTSHDVLAQKIEHHVAKPSQRFQAIEQCRQADLYCGVLMMPILPYITDNWKLVADLVYQSHAVGANYIYPLFGMTLRDRQRDYYLDKVGKLSQDVSEKYQQHYKNTYYFGSPHAKKLWYEFQNLCTKLGITYQMEEIIHHYQKPYQVEQGTLF